MPAIEKSNRKQYAVLWATPISGSFDPFGESRIEDPIEIKVRWEDEKSEVGRKATVYVFQEIAEGSVMWKGKLTDLPPAPEKPRNLMQVVQYNETPDVKGRVNLRAVRLVLLGSQLPSAVE